MTAALVLLRRFWPALAIAGLLIAGWLYIGHVDRTARAEQKAADYAAVEKAEAAAKLAHTEAARAKEQGYAKGTKDANDALAPKLDGYRGQLADYVARLRDQAAQGATGGRSNLPGAPRGTNLADSADPLPLMDDLERCNEAVARLENAQDWWLKLEGAR